MASTRAPFGSSNSSFLVPLLWMSIAGKTAVGEKKDEKLRRQFVRAQSPIFPTGHPQERTLSLVFFLNRYGPALVERLLEGLLLEMGSHWLITI